MDWRNWHDQLISQCRSCLDRWWRIFSTLDLLFRNSVCIHHARTPFNSFFVVVFSSLSQTQDKEKKKKKFWKETVHAASCAVFCFVSLFFFYFHFPPSSTSILLRELLYFGQPSPSAASRGGQWRRPAAVPGMSSGTLLVVFFSFSLDFFFPAKEKER